MSFQNVASFVSCRFGWWFVCHD